MMRPRPPAGRTRSDRSPCRLPRSRPCSARLCGQRRPLKLYVLDASGYEIPGVPAKQASKAGSAVFNLGNRHGEFSYYVDAGVFGDLFWEERRASFHL